MSKASIQKNYFNTEKNPIFRALVKEILSNRIANLKSFQAWQNFISKYIDPGLIHRKKDIKEFENIFKADFFEILFAIQLIVYLLVKKLLENVKIPKNIKADLFQNIYEDALNKIEKVSKNKINQIILGEFQNLDYKGIISPDDLLESIYREIIPREIRKPLGEYFTPRHLAERMVAEVDQKHDQDIWMDNSSGFGVFLFAYLNKFGIKNIHKFICIEVNPLSVFITKIALLLKYQGKLKTIRDLPIYWGDVLLNEKYQYKGGAIVKVGNYNSLKHKVGVIIGNPPWVSWKSMSKQYQNLIGADWRSYDIFEKNITRKNLGACNDDISSYFVYYSIDKFLKDQGRLKFVINLTLFKSNLMGKQFRQFQIQKNNTPLKLVNIQDLTNYKIFPGITNPYCVFEALKGKKTTYPIPYFLVYGQKNGQIERVVKTTARPVESDDDNGAILTINGNEENFQSIEGLCEYKARAGVCTWLNSVYWVRKIKKKGKLIMIANLAKSGKNKLKEIKTQVEAELVFRLLRARNLDNFEPKIENHIIVPQQQSNLSKPIPEILMKKNYQNAYQYFSNFRDELMERSGYKKFLNSQPFYGLYNIGPYTKAPIKLGWQFVSKSFQVYLIKNAGDIIPDLNVMFIPLDDLDEAYYLHALLNSKYAREKIESSSNWTFPGGSIQKVYLEKYDSKNNLHLKISKMQRNMFGKISKYQPKKMDEYFRDYWFNGRKKKTETGLNQLALG